MIAARSRCALEGAALSRLSRPVCFNVVVRYASYSKQPFKKDGSLDALIYNDALVRGKLHVLPGQEKLQSGWTHVRGTKADATVEPFPVPHHEFTYTATPLMHKCDGGWVGQRIEYDEILPRCAGKTSKLEWGSLTEEDRYTKRNWIIRCAQKHVAKTQEMSNTGGKNYYYQDYAKVLVVMGLVYYGAYGMPTSNDRTMNSLDPADQSELFTKENAIVSVPVLGYLMKTMTGRHWQNTQSGTNVNRYPLWAEFDGKQENLRIIDAHASSALVADGFYNWRDTSPLPRVPSAAFRDKHECYYDGAEGPDRIGNYNMYSWKTGEQTNNVKISGDCSQGCRVIAPSVFHNGS